MNDQNECIERHGSEQPATPELADGGGPAFPVPLPDHNGQWRSTAIGVTVRDWFAGKAMAAMLAADTDLPSDAAAGEAYKAADAMLAERAKGGAS